MEDSNIKLPSNKKFGFFIATVCALGGSYFLYANLFHWAKGLLVLAVVIFIITIIKAQWLLPLNKMWMRFGWLLGMIVSPIVLGVIFYGLFTPIGILMRLGGRDELRLKLQPRQSYWKLRKPDDLATHSFKQQF